MRRSADGHTGEADNSHSRCHEIPRPHRPHRHQIQVLGIGNMCLVRCILLISIKKRNRLRFSCISDLHFLLLLLFSERYRCIWGRCSRCGVSFRDTLIQRRATRVKFNGCKYTLSLRSLINLQLILYNDTNNQKTGAIVIHRLHMTCT